MFINYFRGVEAKVNVHYTVGSVYEFIPISMAVCYQTRFLLHWAFNRLKYGNVVNVLY